MNLSVKDRILLIAFLPKEGDLLTQILVKDVRNKTELTQKELLDCDFKVVDSGYVWDDKKAKNKVVDFTGKELELLKSGVERLDKENKITQDILELCLKIKEQLIEIR